MIKYIFILLLSLFTVSLYSQVRLTSDEKLHNDIIKTGLIHSPLKIDLTKSTETLGLEKKILETKTIELKGWQHSGYGKMQLSDRKTISGVESIRLSFPSFTGKRAQGSPSDPDYATYGSANISLDLVNENWEDYNRIAFYIYPDCEGARVVNMNLSIENGDISPKDGYNRQSGSHLINLVNKEWNKCYLDIGEYRRDKVKSIGFGATIKGKDRTSGDSLIYYFNKIELQQIENPEIISGWMPQKGSIVYSTTGYTSEGQKTAIVHIDKKDLPKTFGLVDIKSKKTVFTSNIQEKKTSIGTFNVLDFSSFDKVGHYQLKVGNITTQEFTIATDLWDNSIWRVLNFIFCQRCGYPVPGIHSTCHLDLCSQHDGKKISFAGGWHDAGDLSQQVLQTGDVTFALLEMYNKLKGKNDLLASRLLEEAEWGLEFVLKNRYGDGYRASSVGLLIWQDGIHNTLDDINSVRVHNSAFDNFLLSAYEAYAALTIDRDPMLQEHLTKIAKEDFEFALKRHDEVGYGEFLHFYEHSYNTSESQYMATISWAASMLYKLTREPYYAQKAVDYINYTLACQRKEPLNDANKTRGFFYRDKSKQVIVHYNHQSRDHTYMQAITLLCETQPKHPDYNRWVESITLHAEYIKGLVKYTDPYGMLASGVYHIDEAKDKVSFQHSHLFTEGDEKDRFVVQLKNGIKLDNEHYVKRFPVGFGIFNGNTAIHLAMGKTAAICGNFLNDKQLLQIGKEQLYWTVGKNPFGQSLIFGEGYNYSQLDSFSSGMMTGSMPVGIRSLGDLDIPYWPTTNNATYKEVWLTSAGKWLTLISEY